MMKLTPQLLLSGYASGIFPMAEGADSDRLHWFDPAQRGVLPIGGVRASRSTRRDLRRGGWAAQLNHDFEHAVRACADRRETWINKALFDLYMDLHAAGFAHSFEVYRQGRFAGAMFGIALRGAFFGESMMSAQTNGSKMALLWASQTLLAGGFSLFDTQYLTAHLASLGGVAISRDAYRTRLSNALEQDAILPTALPDADQLLQEITQIS